MSTNSAFEAELEVRSDREASLTRDFKDLQGQILRVTVESESNLSDEKGGRAHLESKVHNLEEELEQLQHQFMKLLNKAQDNVAAVARRHEQQLQEKDVSYTALEREQERALKMILEKDEVVSCLRSKHAEAMMEVEVEKADLKEKIRGLEHLLKDASEAVKEATEVERREKERALMQLRHLENEKESLASSITVLQNQLSAVAVKGEKEA